LQLPPSDPLCGGAVYPQQAPSFSLPPLPPQSVIARPLLGAVPRCPPGVGHCESLLVMLGRRIAHVQHGRFDADAHPLTAGQISGRRSSRR